MKKYHKYVFDEEARQFIGDFEAMYEAEGPEAFDSWQQEDQRKLWLAFIESILGNYNFESILDLGCGKGAFTHRLKKSNNEVLGLDMSQKAIDQATARYPDCDFENCNLSDLAQFKERVAEQEFDLALCIDVLSYLKNWGEFLKETSQHTRYCLVSLYIPYNPIGYVKSMQELRAKFDEYYDIKEEVYLANRNIIILFGEVIDHGK